MIPEAPWDRFVPAQTMKAFTSFLRQECTERMFAPDRHITEAADDRSTTAPIVVSASDPAGCLSANLCARAILRLSGARGLGSRRDRWRLHRQRSGMLDSGSPQNPTSVARSFYRAPASSLRYGTGGKPESPP